MRASLQFVFIHECSVSILGRFRRGKLGYPPEILRQMLFPQRYFPQDEQGKT